MSNLSGIYHKPKLEKSLLFIKTLSERLSELDIKLQNKEHLSAEHVSLLIDLHDRFYPLLKDNQAGN